MSFKTALCMTACGMAAAPAAAVTPVSGSLRASIDVFVSNGNIRGNALGLAEWTAAPEQLSYEINRSVSVPVPVGLSDARAQDSASWSADGLSGRVDLAWSWFLRSFGDDLVGASFEDSAPNWSYTFTADRNGRLIWEGQVRPGPGFGTAPNQPFGLTGWDLTLNGQTVISLIDPNDYTVRQGDGDFALTAGETYSFALVNRSNIAGRTFDTQPFYAGRMLGEFGWLIEEDLVPEPATWAMMILGFGAIGGQLRRRRPIIA